MVRGFIAISLALALLLTGLAGAVATNRCSVMTDRGAMPDADCDGAPDGYDNCPVTANSLQEDLNRNGIGDACDLLITQIRVDPDSRTRQGDIARINVRLINDKALPITDALVSVRNTDLRIDERKSIPYLPSGAETTLVFFARIPACAAPNTYPLTITSEFRDDNGALAHETQRIDLDVERGDACGAVAGPLDATLIDVRNRADIDRGESAVFPIRITNLGDKQARYTLQLLGTDTWATWSIDPDADVTLPAGRDMTLYLRIETNDDARPGMRELTLQTTSGSQTTSTSIAVYVRAPIQLLPPWIPALQAILLALLILLLLGAILVAARRVRREGRRGERQRHDDGAQRVEVVDIDDADRSRAPAREHTAVRRRARKSVVLEDADDDERFQTNY